MLRRSPFRNVYQVSREQRDATAVVRTTANDGGGFLQSHERAENLRRYICTLLGTENVHPAAIDAIGRGEVEWDEVERAGEHWRQCSHVVGVREAEKTAHSTGSPDSGDNASKSLVPALSTRTRGDVEAALKKTEEVLHESRARLEQFTHALALVHKNTPSSSQSRTRSPSPLMPVPEGECISPGAPSRRLAFSPGDFSPATPSTAAGSPEAPPTQRVTWETRLGYASARPPMASSSAPQRGQPGPFSSPRLTPRSEERLVWEKLRLT